MRFKVVVLLLSFILFAGVVLADNVTNVGDSVSYEEAVPVIFSFGMIFIFVLLLFLVIFGILIFLIVFWILMIVDCAKRDFGNPDEKLPWILVLVFAGWIGAIIYYFVIKRKAKK